MIILKSFIRIIKVEDESIEVETFNTKLQKTIRLPRILFEEIETLNSSELLVYQVNQRENKTLYHEVTTFKK